jgi:hypothetical protein
MAIRRRAAPAPSSVDENQEQEQEIDFKKIFETAQKACSGINTAKLDDCLSHFLKKNLTELATMEGNASTILLSQFAIYFKRNYGETTDSIISRECPDFLVAIDRAKIISSRRKQKQEIF